MIQRTKLWLDSRINGWLVRSVDVNGRIRTERKTLTLLASEAELMGLARKHGLKLDDTGGYLSAEL